MAVMYKVNNKYKLCSEITISSRVNDILFKDYKPFESTSARHLEAF